MALNWTLEVYINLLSGIPHLLAYYLLIKHYNRHKDPIILSLAITWLSYGLFWMSNGLAYLLLEEDIFRYNKILLIIASYALIIGFDFIMREGINPIEFAFITLLNGLIIFVVFDTNSVQITALANGDSSISHIGIVRDLLTILGLFVSAIYLYYTYRLYSQSPEQFKKYALVLFMGSFIFGPVVMISFIFQLDMTIPGLAAFFSGFGVLLSTIAIQKSPQLIYVQSVNAIKLSVIDETSGLTLYKHDWNPDLINVADLLMSSVIESFSSFTEEVFGKGHLKEISFSQAVIYVHQSETHKINFVLISSNRSKVLERNLNTFVNLFEDEYYKELNMLPKPAIEITEFGRADELIPQAFPYIPFYG